MRTCVCVITVQCDHSGGFPLFCSVNPLTSPEKRLEDLLRLGELCIEVLQQNEEHHSEVWLILLFWWNTHIDALS